MADLARLGHPLATHLVVDDGRSRTRSFDDLLLAGESQRDMDRPSSAGHGVDGALLTSTVTRQGMWLCGCPARPCADAEINVLTAAGQRPCGTIAVRA
ncbi:hypothetical protein [Nannocystis pusilla]|uniref:hypothetical protein n=1 Tax=Nannocystis pusilla TaxID=889268 RepID=UPI003DA436A7